MGQRAGVRVTPRPVQQAPSQLQQRVMRAGVNPPTGGSNVQAAPMPVQRVIVQQVPVQQRQQVVAQRPAQQTPKPIYDYGDTHLDIGRLRADSARIGTAAEFYELQSGRNSVRFLPNPTGGLFYAWGLQSFIPNADVQGNGKYIISPKTLDADAYCPIASVIDKLQRQGSLCGDQQLQRDAKRLADALQPREIFLSNVLVQQPDGSSVVRVMRYTRSVYRGLVSYIDANAAETDPELAAEAVNIAHPATGVKVIIEKTGADFKTRYSVTVTNKQQPVGTDILAARVDVASRMTPTDVADIEEALLNLFVMDDFQLLIDPDTAIQLPVLEERSRGPRNVQQQQRGRVQQPVNVVRAQQRTLVPAVVQRTRSAPVAQQAVQEDDLPPVEEEVTVPAEEAGGALYQCFGAYGSPEQGLDCNTCELGASGQCQDVALV